MHQLEYIYNREKTKLRIKQYLEFILSSSTNKYYFYLAWLGI